MRIGKPLIPISILLLLLTVLDPVAAVASKFELLEGTKIEILFKGFEATGYPHEQSYKENRLWELTFNKNGTWDAERRGRLAYGSWRVEKDALCVEVDDHDTQYPPKTGCFGVAVDFVKGDVALLIQDRNDPFVIEEFVGDRLVAVGRPKQVAIEKPKPDEPARSNGQQPVLSRTPVESPKATGRPEKPAAVAPPVAADDPIAKERARLAEIAALERDKLAAAKRELERLRTQLEIERLKREKAALLQSQPARTATPKRQIPDIDFGNYFALVIGINGYKSLPKLNTAVTDATAVAETLRNQYGFDVQLLVDPDRATIIDAFDELRERLGENDNLLIYYAGHGWLDQQSGRGYWLPVNAKPDRRSRWLSNSDLTDALQALLAKHVIVVADSCYSGTLTRSIKVPERNPAYIKRMAEKRTRVVLASGGLEPVADSGGGKHSVFAAQFLNALHANKTVLDGTKLFERVRHKVVLNAQQTPEYSDIRLAGHEGGDFLFVRRK